MSSDTTARTLGGADGENGSTPWRPGARVGAYELLERLGAGGMGVVFRARHVQTGAIHAIKTLVAQVDPEQEERLLREAQAQAQGGSHPNVVRVHACGKAFGRPYMVLELLTGGSLADRLRRGPLPWREAVKIVRDLARGLGHMHARGISHRDLKPGNVLFAEDGTPKLVDFGLALLPDVQRLTQTGDILGTPAFMAPEQARGARSELGPWTDVFALGTVLYAALAGDSPFVAETVYGTLAKVEAVDLVSLSVSRPDLPPALAVIVAGAHALAPRERPTAADFADSLDALLGAAASPSGKSLPVAALVAGAAGLSTLALAGVALLLGSARSTPPLTGRPSATPASPSVKAPAPVASTSSATPAPVSSAVPSLAATWVPGETARYRVKASSLTSYKGDKTTITSRRELTLSLRPLSARERSTELEVTLEGLVVHFDVDTPVKRDVRAEDMWAPVHFDSTQPEDTRPPYQRVIGRTFRLTQSASGALAARGVGELATLLCGGAPERSVPWHKLFKSCPELLGDEGMVDTLDQLFAVLPGGPLPASFTIARGTSKRLRYDLGTADAEDSLDVVANVRGSKGPRGYVLSWSGSFSKEGNKTRSLEGGATFLDGRTLGAHQDETVDSPYLTGENHCSLERL